MRTFLTSIMFLVLAAASAAAQLPVVADIAVARIDDLGTPFDLKANLYLPPEARTAPVPLLLTSTARVDPTMIRAILWCCACWGRCACAASPWRA